MYIFIGNIAEEGTTSLSLRGRLIWIQYTSSFEFAMFTVRSQFFFYIFHLTWVFQSLIREQAVRFFWSAETGMPYFSLSLEKKFFSSESVLWQCNESSSLLFYSMLYSQGQSINILYQSLNFWLTLVSPANIIELAQNSCCGDIHCSSFFELYGVVRSETETTRI